MPAPFETPSSNEYVRLPLPPRQWRRPTRQVRERARQPSTKALAGSISPPMLPGLTIGDVKIPGRVLTAPMTGVSDLPFRRIASRCGAAYVATEMVACDSFARGRPDVVRRAAIGDGLPLMVIQLVGRTPEWIAKGAKLAEEAGADIIDLNMGCPAKEVTGALSGSALMREPDLAARLIEAAVNATTRP